MRRTYREIIIDGILIFVFIIGLIINSGRIIVATQIIALSGLLYKIRKNQLLVLISVFFVMYSIPQFLYFFADVGLSAYVSHNNVDEYFFTLIVHTIFVLVFFMRINDSCMRIDDRNLELTILDSPFIFWICILGAILTIVVGRSGQTIFTRGGYGAKGVFSGSALYEYCYIFYYLGYVFCGRKKHHEIILKLVFMIYVIRGLLYGARIEILAMGILVYICFYRNKFKTRNVIIVAILAWFGLSVFGIFRATLSFEFNGIGQLYGYNQIHNRIVNNESEVFYTSTVIISSVRNGFVDVSYRANSLLNYFVRLIIPSSLLNGYYNVVPFLQKEYSACGGGGFFSAFMYFYGGYIGVTLGAFLAAGIWNRLGKISAQTPAWQIFIIISVVMTPRWFAYSPEAIVKIPLYTLLLFNICRSLFLRNTKRGITNENTQ